MIFEGVGLHTGRPARVVVRPAPPDHGLVLRRVDVQPPVTLPAQVGFLAPARRCTALGFGEVTVLTVEHLLAALAGLGVDNALIEVEGPEVPALDGSALPFVEAMQQAGLVELGECRRMRRLARAVWAGDAAAGAFAVAMPAERFSVTYAFISDHPGLADQFAAFDILPEVFAREVAPARTVAFREEVEALLREGLGRGGSRENVVLVGPAGVEGKLRFADEVVRHKVLDLVGDLALAGPLSARVIAVRSGHRLAHELARRIVASGTPAGETILQEGRAQGR